MRRYLTIAVLLIMATTGLLLLKRAGINNRPKGSIDTAKVSPNQLEETPKFSISVTRQPIYENEKVEATFSVEIENIAVEPFITNVGLNTCTLIDTRGNTYQTSIYAGEEQLIKALQIGEKTEVTFERVGLMPNLAEESETECQSETQNSFTPINKLEKCVLNPAGECICTPLGELNLASCEIAVTNDSKQASNGWGNFQETLYFNK